MSAGVKVVSGPMLCRIPRGNGYGNAAGGQKSMVLKTRKAVIAGLTGGQRQIPEAGMRIPSVPGLLRGRKEF